MGLPRHDDPHPTERDLGRRPHADRMRHDPPHLSDADLAAIRRLLADAEPTGWAHSLARMPRVTLVGGLAVWGLALHGLWHLVT